MKQTVDRAASDPFDSGLVPYLHGEHTHDVPGMLASRIGDLYATEELLDRKERAGRLLRRVVPPAEE